MGVIKNIETIYEWTNRDLDHHCGLYRVTLKSSDTKTQRDTIDEAESVS